MAKPICKSVNGPCVFLDLDELKAYDKRKKKCCKKYKKAKGSRCKKCPGRI